MNIYILISKFNYFHVLSAVQYGTVKESETETDTLFIRVIGVMCNLFQMSLTQWFSSHESVHSFVN